MSIETRVYGSAPDGPLDRGTVLATVSGPPWEWESPDPAPEGVIRFGVRNHDTVTGLDDLNTDAVATLVVGPGGEDLSARPPAVGSLGAEWIAPDSIRVSWLYLWPAARPEGFRILISAAPGPPDFGDPPAATEAFRRGATGYSVEVSGLAEAGSYAVSVRAYAGPLDDGSEAFEIVGADPDGPAAVEDLDVEVVSWDGP